MNKEDQKREVATVEGPGPPAPRITLATIAEREQQIALLQDLVERVLEPNLDYGRVEGISTDFLWDPGASKIIAAFGCYVGDRRIIRFEQSELLIAVCLEVHLISRETGMKVGTGIGAASTMETRYKYRWVRNPAEWGFSPQDSTLKTKGGSGGWAKQWRIPNPETSELLHTITTIASKRAEVDAAKALPGVGSRLRELFDSKKRPVPQSRGPGAATDLQEKDPPGPQDQFDMWSRFWGETRRLGLTQEEVHQRLGVASVKEGWIRDKGKTLDQAISELRVQMTRATDSTVEDRMRRSEARAPVPGSGIVCDVWLITTYHDFCEALHRYFPEISPEAGVRITGCSNPQDVKSWPQAFLAVANHEGLEVIAPEI